ncbi:MptD family putative ECF transporter S component [Propionibacterium australiense]|uniref:Trep_Strep domain-containing protein n=1 Tax=Propionibacterium australiense TaxID=119981 RepID=A0A8B3FJL6_9ACTN|nr:MptD family putative ECF transporter S component [Propionibacterium australiense]RLP06647.1 Trep_Strep domain-containing protein [Propionibacterium australiense]
MSRNDPATPQTLTTAPESVQRRNSRVRDYVTMGVFIALYIVLFMFCGMIMAAVPIIMVLLPVIFGLFGGLIFTVLLGKVQRPGSFLTTGLILGLGLITMAPGGSMCYMTILGGIVAELIHSRLGRRSFRSMAIAYSAFIACYAIGEYIPFVWMKQAYLDQYADNATLEVARVGTELLNPLTMAVFCVLGVVAAVIGCRWGRALTRKQFRRAGIV